MNLKKLLTIAALTGFSASVATGQGTAPTIVQGDYISNVFGNSNFIKNPNAKLNTKDVAVSSATVTRSPTTPLVATSEFNVTITSANGTVTWDARAFDAGMKNQNCEARFTYRGFQSTSKVQIKQSTNVVAELALTASTDPRIASINFPCGDLSQLTKFVVTDTSTLSGVNEIGGIYVGLATNMANVAQAESVFRSQDTNGASIPNATPTQIVFPSVVFDSLSGYNASTGVYTVRKAGRYLVHARVAFQLVNPFPAGIDNYLLLNKNGNSFSTAFWSTSSYAQYPNPQITGIVDLAVGDTVNVVINQTTGGARNLLGSNALWSEFSISRFPTSSELVVTPERQNVFAGAQWSGTKGFQRTNTTEIIASDAVYSTNRSIFGKAQFTGTANDVAITVPAMPPGTYKIELSSNYLSAQRDSTGTGDFGCQFTLKDNSGVVATSAAAQYGVQYSINSITVVSAVTTYTSVADRTFTAYLQSTNAAATVDCYVSAPKIIITPLDQPSNSALYVQGPVLASQTGAAIPAGYVGQAIYSTGTLFSRPSGVSSAITTTISVPPGVWLVQTRCRGALVAPTLMDAFIDDSSNNVDSLGAVTNIAISSPSNTTDLMDVASILGYYRVTTTKTLGAGCGMRFPTAGGQVEGSIRAYRIN